MIASRSFVVLVAVAALCGCSELPKRDPAKGGPFFTPANVTRLGRLPEEMRRVVVLPAYGGPQITEDSLQRIDQVVLEELNRTGRFETTLMSRDDFQRLAGARTLSSLDALPPDLLDKVAKMFGADGVLFTDVTTFSAYPPLTLGLRMKLAHATDHQIIWAADNTFSASDPAVANSARRHALKMGSDRGPGDLSHTVLQNPTRFAAYATAATFESLPPR